MAVTDLPERLVRRFDDYQQDRWWLAHPVGTVRKYADDRGSALAGLVTFQMFLGMLPLLVVVLTVSASLLEGSDRLQDAALDSTIAQFPLIGDRLREDISALSVDGPWLAVAVGGLLWTATGIYHSMQLALNQVWNVEGVSRQGFVSRHVRAMVLFVLVIGAAVGTAFIRGQNVLGLERSVAVDVASAVAGVVTAVVLLLGVFRIVVSPAVPLRCLVPAAVLAGLLWELLQRIGGWLVMDRLVEAQDLYGAIGFVVVALFWINLLARSAVFANEWAVVSWRELWPRRIAQPPLTEADQRVLVGLVRNERRRPEQVIDVRFEDEETAERVDAEVDQIEGPALEDEAAATDVGPPPPVSPGGRSRP